MTNRQQFVESLARRMSTHSGANPGLYRVPGPDLESWCRLAEKVADSLFEGNGLLSVTVRATLKELGAEPTLKGAKDYLTTPAAGDTLSHD